MNVAIPNLKYPPRLARLYSEDVRRLEALHAGRISPGAVTWEQAVNQLARRVIKVGPAKGAALVGKAIGYLTSIGRDERCHFLISTYCSSRNAFLMFATFACGNHPNPAVSEQGLTIELHIISCNRSHPSYVSGIPVAYISTHALRRLFERGFDITENTHATSIFAFIGVLGYLTHRSTKHVNGGLSLSFSAVLAVGSLHRFTKTGPDGKVIEETFYDVRTVLPANEIGERRQAMLDQGRAAASVVVEWFKDDDPDVKALAERIPRLERREDTYPLRQINQEENAHE